MEFNDDLQIVYLAIEEVMTKLTKYSILHKLVDLVTKTPPA